jgi:hypothetical protein
VRRCYVDKKTGVLIPGCMGEAALGQCTCSDMDRGKDVEERLAALEEQIRVLRRRAKAQAAEAKS